MPGGLRVRVRNGSSVTHVKKPGDQTVRWILASSIIPGWQGNPQCVCARACVSLCECVCSHARAWLRMRAWVFVTHFPADPHCACLQPPHLSVHAFQRSRQSSVACRCCAPPHSTVWQIKTNTSELGTKLPNPSRPPGRFLSTTMYVR